MRKGCCGIGDVTRLSLVGRGSEGAGSQWGCRNGAAATGKGAATVASKRAGRLAVGLIMNAQALVSCPADLRMGVGVQR